MDTLMTLAADPAVWAALITLIVMEVVLGIDNLIFISILSNKLPPEHRTKARRIGIGLALIMRLVLLSTLAFIVGLTAPVFELPWHGALDEHGKPAWELAFSWRDLILIAGGLFLIAKATHEIHQKIEGAGGEPSLKRVATSFGGVIAQIMVLDIVFSLDSIITAVGMVDERWVMVTAILVSIAFMLAFAGPIGDFVERHPTVKVLALSFLLMIGLVLIADGFGQHIPKGYVYAAMAFSVFVEFINLWIRRREMRAAEAEAKDG